MSDDDPYNFVDPILMPWARRHGLHVYKLHRDDHVRSISIVDRLGDQRAGIWLELPNACGEVIVHAVDVTAPAKVGRYERQTATLENLDGVLEDLHTLILEWSDPGAFG
jgi:hypothetical protein